jgi:hypothetical protein
MSRLRSEPIRVKPTNNVYTALLGAACLAALMALAFGYVRWQEIVGSDGPKLFFGFF